MDNARFAPGDIFASRYRIVSLLGRGARGEVYRAQDLKLRHDVAVRLLPFHSGTAGGDWSHVFAEVRLARTIAHPYVCRVYDVGEADGRHYLSMEYVDGETLDSLFRRIGRLPLEKALDIARQLCAGVAAAHECGVLHGNLKPSHVMIDGNGRARILDFGLAIAARDAATSSAYIAPEQLIGGYVTERSDVFSLGLVLYEIFHGGPLVDARALVGQSELSGGTAIA